MEMKSKFLLVMVAIAFLSQLSFYIIFRNSESPLLYPLGFLLSAIVYLLLISMSEIISYLISVFYLVKESHNFFKSQKSIMKPSGNGSLFPSFFKYGAPLSLWFVFAYLLSYVDKLFMFHFSGAEAQGNYQALFDLLSRSLTLLITPVVTSMFPILTAAYESEDRSEIRKFVKKIIKYELLGFLVVSVLYWWFGTNLLVFLLKVPDTTIFKCMGYIVICDTFIWQLAILAQKRFEMEMKSKFLLVMVAIAFLSQLSFYIIFRNSESPLLYPLGFLLSAIVYLLLISMSEIISFLKTKWWRFS